MGGRIENRVSSIRYRVGVDVGGEIQLKAMSEKRIGRYEIEKTIGRGAMGVVYLARDPITRGWYASYHSLVHDYAFHTYGDGYRTTPGRFGARASKLYEILRAGHYDVKLSAEEMHRITLWLDCTSMFYGVYEKEPGLAQLRGEIVRPTLE